MTLKSVNSYQYIGRFLIVSAENSDGDRIMVYENVKIDDIYAVASSFSHVLTSPIAMFHPSTRGMEYAVSFATSFNVQELN